MIKTILLLLLLTTPAAASDHMTPELCQEIAIVLQEHVDNGYIKEQEADVLLARCNASL